MQRLRLQVDKIDLKLLKLLQQRTKLSGEIGRTKRRHGAEIYVPGRERELLARVAGQAAGKLPACAVAAIFREILSSSRAAQGQAPIGLLRESAEAILLSARWQFGACDRFVTKKSWREIARELGAGRLEIALLTMPDLAAILGDARSRGQFLESMSLVGDFSTGLEANGLLEERVFILKARRKEARMAGRRVLILIECKNTAHAVKSLLTSMPQRPIHSEHVNLFPSRERQDSTLALLGLTLARALDAADSAGSLDFLSRSGLTTSIVGIYPGGEDYGG
jgi:chorismate mutase